MKYLVFDTETTGLPIRKSYNEYFPFTDFSKYTQSRIVSIAWSVYEDLDHIKSAYHIIKPEDFTINNNGIATKINGITQEIAEEKGKELKKVLEEFENDIYEKTVLVAHNLDFDKHVILAEVSHMGNLDLTRKILKMSKYCTMKNGINIAKIKNSRYPNRFKFPRLSELFYHFHGYEFQNAHNAQADVDACTKCYQKLIGLK